MPDALHFYLRSPADFELSPTKLSSTEARTIVHAKEKLIAALELEETYLALVEDFIEFESTVFNATIRHTVRNIDLGDKFHELRRSFNRCIMHVLSTARSYIYSVDKTVSQITCDYEYPIATLKAAKAQQYDTLLGYRVMEALRNSAQHHGLPLHGLTIGGEWLRPSDKNSHHMHIYTVPTFTTAELSEDPKFNKSVLRELGQLGEKHNVRRYLREYVMGLSYVHQDFHSVTATALEAAESVILDVIHGWAQKHDLSHEPEFLLLCPPNPGSREVHIMSEPINRRRTLERDSPALINLHLAVVSGSTDVKFM